ncbi:zinc ribbon domain-containing protein [Joostella atrarenae]|uniref:Zinc ribbon domain-containing protein n=1 Tax=Joostella atrarenae TaxID=679257 RepID=A0ABS9IZV3_9FLAO|nr:zinc ribbon domain-containing protein [Joostella atrarenae]MCF8713704.1 zinc ribbon domain-containing protein [Joostella atrarenae]
MDTKEKINCSNCDAENFANAKYCSQCGHTLPKQNLETPEYIAPQKEKKKTGNTKRITSIVVGVIAAILSFYFVQKLFSPSAYDEVLVKVSNEINKTCPFMVDQDTRLDNSVVLPNNTLQYNYTLVNLEKSELNIDEFKSNIEPNIINSVKTNPDMADFRKNEVTLKYDYKDKKGVFLLNIKVTPDDYK